jgi:3-oxoacyl-(acyl-carrier-protein) synthase/aryl carrier-like protein
VTGDDAVASASRDWLDGPRPHWSAHWEAMLPNVSLPPTPTEPSRHWMAPPAPVAAAPASQARPEPAESADVLDALRAAAAEFLLVDPDEVDVDGDLLETGFDSVTLTELAEKLNDTLGLDLLPTVFFEHPTLRRCAEHLGESQPRAATTDPPTALPVEDTHDIAIVGMAGRFPGADDADAFWNALREGRDLVGPPPSGRDDLLAHPGLAAVQGGFLASIGDFDPAPFGISPTEADLMDPQQRLFLTAAWQAIEHSGRRPESLRGTATGVWAGVSTIDYADTLRGSSAADEAHAASGLSHAVLANRVSHVFDLRGPSMAVDTACSSSLVALHNAVLSLRGKETDFALVGGVNALLSPALFVSFERSGMLSPTGRCRSFDAAADGYVRGEGGGVGGGRRLADAGADGDRILAVIKGTALGHGANHNALPAPNPAAPAGGGLRPHGPAGVDPADVHAVETHGTGTRLGDPIEAQALTAAFTDLHRDHGRDAAPRASLRIGTVKSNIGHLEAAAGVAGVIKAVQALRHRELPPTLHVEHPNPLLRIDDGPLLLNTAPHRWDESGTLHMGVSSFGFGGANAHVVLASAEPQDEPEFEPTAFAPRRHWFDRGDPAKIDHARPGIRLVPVAASTTARAGSATPPAPAAAPLATQSPVPVPEAVADDDLALIAGHLADILGTDADDIEPDTNLDALGLDSIFRMDLVRRLHRDRGVTFPAAELYDMATVAHLMDRLRSGQPATSDDGVPAILAALISSVVGTDIGPDVNAVEAGMTSFHMLRVVSRLEKRLGTLPKTLLYDHPVPRGLAEHLAVEPGRLDGVLEDADGGDVYRWDAGESAKPTRVFRKSDTAADPALHAIVSRLTAEHGRESGLAGRDIAPLGFLGSSQEAFLHFSRSGRDLLSWNYTGPESAFADTAAEWFDYAERNGLRANLLSMSPLDRAGDHQLTATPFGALQRLERLAEFTVTGARMRRLRYMVNRFARAGTAAVVEHTPGTDPAADAAVVGLIGPWGESKTMVNPYVAVIMSELEQGRLDPRHRMFLTYLDGQVVNAVIVTDIPAERGYLLDMEFYPPHMPLGGLDYAIVEIMYRLRDEGAAVFSFGASFGGDLTDAAKDSDTELAQALRQMREVGAFGPGNFQFKNKFRPVNHPLYLCQSATGATTGAADVILMIAEPDLDATAPGLDAPSAAPAPAAGADPRLAALAAADYNVTAIAPDAVDFDLITDSWSEYTGPAVAERTAELAAAATEHGPDLNAPPWLAGYRLHPVPSGRAAEDLLCRLWPYRRGTVLHDHAFPTWISAFAEHGFDAAPITEAPGPFDAAALDVALERTSEVAFVLLEPHSNAAAGRALTLEDLDAAREACRRAEVPLVLDAARALDDALANGPDAWETLRRSLAGAAAVTVSLSKTFGVSGGGVLARAPPPRAPALDPLAPALAYAGRCRGGRRAGGRPTRTRPRRGRRDRRARPQRRRRTARPLHRRPRRHRMAARRGARQARTGRDAPQRPRRGRSPCRRRIRRSRGLPAPHRRRIGRDRRRDRRVDLPQHRHPRRAAPGRQRGRAPGRPGRHERRDRRRRRRAPRRPVAARRERRTARPRLGTRGVPAPLPARRDRPRRRGRLTPGRRSPAE